MNQRFRGKQVQAIGAQAERTIQFLMSQMGFRFVEPIETGWRVQRIKGRITGATPIQKVSGDITAVTPHCRPVHVEVKSIVGRKVGNKFVDDRLSASAIDTHQRKALNDKSEFGVYCYLGVVSFKHRFQGLIPWSADLIPPRSSVSLDVFRELAIDEAPNE